ncbi:putative chromatin regulator PHD family [Helianthus annuus]|nr:putative chromatin regulator PHD family [Helianthus annuus]
MLTLSCFSDLPDYIKCRICEGNFDNKFWIYQCSKCRFYIHLHCKTSRGDIFSRGIGTSDTNFEAADYPNLLRYPLPDESHHILPRHVVREHCDQITLIDNNDKGLYRYSNHEHPLLLINAADPSMLHNPMKRIKLVCNGCVKPITTTPFYVCNHGCDFLLHEWCTRLPCALENHPCHPQHKLVLFFSTTGTRLVEFRCNICGLSCNGLGYSCSMCNYRVDVHCGFIPERITHEAHPNHVLSRLDHDAYRLCKACNVSTRGFFFGCSICDFYLDIKCALHLPKRIKNKYDKHPLELSYFPIENHKSEYFCEVCEEELIPEIWFYHCHACGQSIHSACGPLILQSEQDVNSIDHQKGVYQLLNIKFWGLYATSDHEHPFSYLAGSVSDGCCKYCGHKLQSSSIVKCLTCKIGFHVKCKIWDTLGWKYEEHVVSYGYDRYRYSPFIVKPVTFYPSEVMRPVTQDIGKYCMIIDTRKIM